MDRIQVPENEYARRTAELAPQGSTAVIAYIYSLPLEERVEAVRSAQKALFAAAHEGGSLDTYAEAMRELIDRGTSALGRVGHNEEDDQTLNQYNAMSFNLAADLADCWPEDKLQREAHHFEAGLRAAEDCVRWRNELNRPPYSFALAYWAKGMHLLSLGHYSGAVKSFAMAGGAARRDAEEKDISAEVGPGTTFSVLLNEGYLGIAEQLDDSGEGLSRLQRAEGFFRDQIARGNESGDTELKEEAEFGIAQLETVRAKYIH